MTGSTGTRAAALGLADEAVRLVRQRVGAAAEAEATARVGTHALTRFANSVIHQNVAEEARTVTIRVVLDGRAAGVTTTAADGDALATAVDRAAAAARLRPPDPDWPGVAPAATATLAERYDEPTARAGPDARAELVRAFVDAGPELAAAGYSATSGWAVAVANTAGQRLCARTTTASLDGVHRSATADANASQIAARVGDLDGAAAGARAAGRARAASDAVDLPPGEYEVVLEPDCTANVLQFLVLHGFSAKAHLEGRSFVRIGEPQLDRAIDIWDDAGDDRSVGLPFDSEGTPKQRVQLVRAGTPLTFVHDRRTAHQMGAASTGHASGSPAWGPFPTNLYLGAGREPAGELVARVERGLLVCDFWYTRILDPKTQVVTGLTRNGVFLVEDGRVRHPVRNLRFTQSYVSALAPGNVLGVSSDARLVGPSAHVPALWLRSWRFTGGAEG